MAGRMDKVNQLVKEEISKIIQHDIDDPNVGFTTVTDVDVQSDLGSGKVYVTIMGNKDETDKSIEALNKASSYIELLLGSRINIKYMPHLNFIADESIEKGARLDEIFDRLEEERTNNNEDENR